MPGTRSFAAGRFALQLDGVSCGFLAAADGGDISADVISEPSGPSGFVKKHIGQPKYEDFELQAGFDLASPSTTGYRGVEPQAPAQERRDRQHRRQPEAGLGAAVRERAAQRSDDPRTRWVIQGGGIPHREVLPGHTRTAKAAGTVGKVPVGKQKAFVASNFRIAIDGLDCTKVSKVDSFTVKQAVSADEHRRGPHPERAEVARVSEPEDHARRIEREDVGRVVRGLRGQGQQRRREREERRALFLSPDRKAELARDHPSQPRHLRAAPPPREPATDRSEGDGRALLRADGAAGRPRTRGGGAGCARGLSPGTDPSSPQFRST